VSDTIALTSTSSQQIENMVTSDTLGQLFFDQTQKYGQKTALRYKQFKPGYQSMSWNDFALFVHEISFGLASQFIKPKDIVAIFSPTSYLWTASDLAVISLGGISVPIYPNSSTADLEYILNNSESKIVFVAGERQLAKLAGIGEKISLVQKIVYLPALTKKEPEWDTLKEKHKQIADKMLHLNELCSLGEDLAKEDPDLIKKHLAENKPEDIATVIYTSGTTGTPKGVPLTHSNILSVLNDLPGVIPINEEDTYFSYLPVSHVFERICGEFYWIYTGCICAYAESIETMSKNLNEIEPTVMVMVPRVLENIYHKMRKGILESSATARTFIEWAVNVGEEIVKAQAKKETISPVLKLQYMLADKSVLSKLRGRIGKRLRFVVCGGAPASAGIVTFLNAIGIPTLEGYGLTETAAPTNVNRIGHVKPGTVGPKLASVEMKFAEDGEILVKGPGIFNGYFKDSQATNEVIKDGWFATGDIGEIDEDGYLKITDRKKDLIVNAAGKNIAPQRIEGVLKTVSPVSQAVVFGDQNKHLVALLTLDEHKAEQLAKEQGWEYEGYPDLAKSQEMHQYLKKAIAARRGDLAEYECIKHFAVLDKELSVEAGELTATLKIKRNVLAQKYADKIASLYSRENC
jgi:long-chain acyl-CoA synthetase